MTISPEQHTTVLEWIKGTAHSLTSAEPSPALVSKLLDPEFIEFGG
ncbi:hypothetical protein ABZS71_03620 [Streptomyces sp. NPDC005393]